MLRPLEEGDGLRPSLVSSPPSGKETRKGRRMEVLSEASRKMRPREGWIDHGDLDTGVPDEDRARASGEARRR